MKAIFNSEPGDVYWGAFVILIMGLIWWSDQSRTGAVLRAVGEDELGSD